MTEEEKDKTKGRDEKIAEFTSEVLDSYFASRSPLPGKSELGEPLSAEYKTTADIADDLADILPVPKQDIVYYLKTNGYHLKTAADGSLRWEIWRDWRYLL